MRKFPAILALAAAGLLAGCWESSTSLYGDRTPLEPFAGGKVEGRNLKDKERDASVLTKEPHGVYRLTNADQNGSDSGDSFTVRFFPLAGAPAKVVVYEALEVKKCKPTDNMCNPSKPDTTLNYGLARLRPNGAEVINPDCKKDSAAAKLPGVKVYDYGTCSFPDRATLEKALLALAGTDWKPDVIYRFTGSPR